MMQQEPSHCSHDIYVRNCKAQLAPHVGLRLSACALRTETASSSSGKAVISVACHIVMEQQSLGNLSASSAVKLQKQPHKNILAKTGRLHIQLLSRTENRLSRHRAATAGAFSYCLLWFTALAPSRCPLSDSLWRPCGSFATHPPLCRCLAAAVIASPRCQ